MNRHHQQAFVVSSPDRATSESRQWLWRLFEEEQALVDLEESGLLRLPSTDARNCCVEPYTQHGRFEPGADRPGRPYVVRAFAAQTAQSLMAGAGTESRSILAACTAVAEGLRYLHTNSLAHGRLRLSNIIGDGAVDWSITDMEPVPWQRKVAPDVPWRVLAVQVHDLHSMVDAWASLVGAERIGERYRLGYQRRDELGDFASGMLEDLLTATVAIEFGAGLSVDDFCEAGRYLLADRRFYRFDEGRNLPLGAAAASPAGFGRVLGQRLSHIPCGDAVFASEPDLGEFVATVYSAGDGSSERLFGRLVKNRQAPTARSSQFDEIIALGPDEEWLEFISFRYLAMNPEEIETHDEPTPTLADAPSMSLDEAIDAAESELDDLLPEPFPAGEGEWLDRELAVATATRSELLAEGFITDSELAEFHGFTHRRLVYWLCRSGILIGVKDRGRILLPTFQFVDQFTPSERVLRISDAARLRPLSWESLAWWYSSSIFGTEVGRPVDAIGSEDLNRSLLDLVLLDRRDD